MLVANLVAGSSFPSLKNSVSSRRNTRKKLEAIEVWPAPLFHLELGAILAALVRASSASTSSKIFLELVWFEQWFEIFAEWKDVFTCASIASSLEHRHRVTKTSCRFCQSCHN